MQVGKFRNILPRMILCGPPNFFPIEEWQLHFNQGLVNVLFNIHFIHNYIKKTFLFM